MKVIDFTKKGNVIKLFLGENDCDDYWGDDWDNFPYEHNSGLVDDRFVKQVAEIPISLDYEVTSPEDDYSYNGNSPYSKEDFKNRKVPFIIIGKQDNSWSFLYSEELEKKYSIPLYYNDSLEEVLDKVSFCVLNGIIIKEYKIE